MSGGDRSLGTQDAFIIDNRMANVQLADLEKGGITLSRTAYQKRD